MISKLKSILFRPTDIAALVFFRIAFGILACLDVLSTLVYYHLKKHAFSPENFQFRYYGFEWLPSWPTPLMTLLLISLMLAAIGIIIGYRYRLFTTYFAIGFTYLFLLEKANYLNHGYLFCWLSVIMIFLPADRNFSWLVWKYPSRRLERMPFWCLFVLRFLIGVVYFFGGIAKINGDWLRGIPLISWMEYKSSLPIIGPILGLSWTPYIMAYVGLLLDLTIVLFLLNRRARIWAFLLAVSFHVLNIFIFNIGIFPYLSISLTLLYFSPDFPRKILAWMAVRLQWLNSIITHWQNRMQAYPIKKEPIWQSSEHYQKVIISALILVMSFHLLVPLRHHLFPGSPAWTEEGHRYSWRMMLRSKRGKGSFKLVNQNGGIEIIKAEDFLTSKQVRKMYTHPDMILQFAHYLRDIYAAEGKDVSIFAEIEVRLNDRPYQTYIDPAVDLAKTEWLYFRHSNWILPLAN